MKTLKDLLIVIAGYALVLIIIEMADNKIDSTASKPKQLTEMHWQAGESIRVYPNTARTHIETRGHVKTLVFQIDGDNQPIIMRSKL